MMARLSLQDQLYNWIGRPWQNSPSPNLLSPRHNNLGSNKTRLSLSAFKPTGLQIGQAARILANQTSPDQESLTVALKHKNLKGSVVTLMRPDFEQAVLHHYGSPEELWRNSSIEKDTSSNFNPRTLLSKESGHKKTFFPTFKFILDQKLSILEIDTGILYRISGLVEIEKNYRSDLSQPEQGGLILQTTFIV